MLTDQQALTIRTTFSAFPSLWVEEAISRASELSLDYDGLVKAIVDTMQTRLADMQAETQALDARTRAGQRERKQRIREWEAALARFHGLDSGGIVH